MGNILLSKFRANNMFHYTLEDKSLKRGVVIAIQSIDDKRIGFCSAHLISRTNRHLQRKQELEQILRVVESKNICEEFFLFGDLNIHSAREHSFLESNQLVDLWTTTHSTNDNGFTFDAKVNSLIQMKYFTMERRRMRLDRILCKGAAYWHPKAPMQLFAHKPIYPNKWDYLFCSDHFGLYIDLSNQASHFHFSDEVTSSTSFGWVIYPWWIVAVFVVIVFVLFSK